MSAKATSEDIPRVLVFDLETTDLAADVGFLLCCGYRWMAERQVRMLRIDQSPRYRRNTTDDGWLVRKVRDVLASADMLVSWYGRNGAFDEPFLRTRCLAHGVPPIPTNIPHWDGQRLSRAYLRLRNNRLANAGALVGRNTKTPFAGPIWMRAIAGHKLALDYIAEHCRRDVEQLAKVYTKMRPYVPHPNLGLFISGDKRLCPTCGSAKLLSKGYAGFATRLYQRFVCRVCGAYCRVVKGEKGAKVR
jgi:uncharacterized protein YprB with RNaseH-like and TPR domain